MALIETHHYQVETRAGIADFTDMGGIAVFASNVVATEKLSDGKELPYHDPDFCQEVEAEFRSVEEFLGSVAEQAA